MRIWAAEADLEEELQDVDLSHAIGNYAQNGVYDDGMSTVIHYVALLRDLAFLQNNLR